MTPRERETAPLAQIAWLFLRLGVTAFGGPAVHVAMMEEEVVRRRRWLSSERFLQLFGAVNLIPGPSSSELAVFIGYERAGWLGLVVAGCCFVLPAAVMTSLLAWAYVRFGALPHVAAALYGIKPVVIGVVLQALWSLAPRALALRTPTPALAAGTYDKKRTIVLAAIGVGACVAVAAGIDAVIVLVAAGMLCLFGRRALPGPRANGLAPVWVAAAAGGSSAAPASVGLLPLFLVFLKLGAIVFGSGYVLLAFMQADLVDRLHWLTQSQLIDAVAVGQVTPGPVFTTATFVGYLVAGPRGAAVATVGIFLPGFLLVALMRPLLARLRQSADASAFLDGVSVASLALMAVVTAQLARSAIVDVATAMLALASAVALLRFKVSSTWVVLAGGVFGVVAVWLH